jgi:hypothetical protein
MTRETLQTDALALGSEPVQCGELAVRPVTFGSLLLLRKLGNPLASAMETGRPVRAENMEAVVEFLWVQCAPLEDVKRIVCGLRLGGDRSELDAALIDFAIGLTPAAVQAALAEITRQQGAIRAAAADVIPDANSKNAKN